MSTPVDVLAVLDRLCLLATDKGAGGHEAREARAAVADAFDVLRMSAEALEAAVKCVDGDLAVVFNDRAMFARAALARGTPNNG